MRSASRMREKTSSRWSVAGMGCLLFRYFIVPVSMEPLTRRRGKIARAGPGAQRIQGRVFDHPAQRKENLGELRRKTVKRRAAHDKDKAGVKNFFRERRFALRRVAPVLEQVMMEVDADRARFRAGAAKRGGRGKVFPILETAQMGRNDRANRTLIGRAVGVPADVSENRAHIQARAAADAVERVALFGVGQKFRAAIVEQDNMKLFRAVALARLARPAVKRVV